MTDANKILAEIDRRASLADGFEFTVTEAGIVGDFDGDGTDDYVSWRQILDGAQTGSAEALIDLRSFGGDPDQPILTGSLFEHDGIFYY